MKAFIFCILFGWSAQAQVVANGPVSVNTRITNVGTYGSGTITIYFEKLVTSCTSDAGMGKRFDIPATNPGQKAFLAIAMTAMALGKEVNVHPGECQGTGVVWTNDGRSYMTIL